MNFKVHFSENIFLSEFTLISVITSMWLRNCKTAEIAKASSAGAVEYPDSISAKK